MGQCMVMHSAQHTVYSAREAHIAQIHEFIKEHLCELMEENLTKLDDLFNHYNQSPFQFLALSSLN